MPDPANLPAAFWPLMLLLRQAQRISELESQVRRLEHLSTTDSLTGLLNRRGFEHAFTAEQERIARRASRGGLVVMIDLDRFKSINDTLGHEAGDKCLQLVANTLKASIRDMDAAARLGGDEFVLLITNTLPDAALSRVQHLSLHLNKLALTWQGQNAFIGASVGIRPVTERESLASILMHADADMYANKRHRGEQPYRLLRTLDRHGLIVTPSGPPAEQSK